MEATHRRARRRIASRIVILTAASLPEAASANEVVYRGTLGKQPIQFFADTASDGSLRAIYAYDRHDTPITMRGQVENGLAELTEQDAEGKAVATLQFPAFDALQPELRGEWIALDRKRRLPIVLQRVCAVTGGEGETVSDCEVLQADSAPDRYFKIVADKDGGTFYARAVALKVLEKGSDKLLQTLEIDTDWRGIDAVLLGDFNFDGVDDISVFEGSYAGPNTSSVYFLRHGDRYEPSGFEGVSLQFDAEKRLVYEHNQCCAGRSHIDTTYQVKNDKLVEVSRECREWDDGKEDLVVVECTE